MGVCSRVCYIFVAYIGTWRNPGIWSPFIQLPPLMYLFILYLNLLIFLVLDTVPDIWCGLTSWKVWRPWSRLVGHLQIHIKVEGCNPIHIFLGVSSTEDSVTYFWVGMHRLVPSSTLVEVMLISMACHVFYGTVCILQASCCTVMFWMPLAWSSSICKLSDKHGVILCLHIACMP